MKAIFGMVLIAFSSWAGTTLLFGFVDWLFRDVRLPLFHYVMDMTPWTAAIAVIVVMFAVGMDLVDGK